jgi:hypothetical protein
MARQQETVGAPFVDDPDFRRAIVASVGGLLLGLVATALTLAFGPVAALTYLAAAALLVWAAQAGRRSSTRSREFFATRPEWKQAERDAVAAVLIRPARLRHPRAVSN